MQSGTPLSTSEKRVLLDALLARTHGAHQVADSKASMLFAASVALVGAVGATASRSNRELAIVIWFIAAGLALLSIVLEAAAAFPRTHAKSASCLFFGSIKAQPVAGFRRDFERLTDEAVVEELYGQVHRNAEIAMAKFWFLKAAWAAFFFGGFLWLTYLWVSIEG